MDQSFPTRQRRHRHFDSINGSLNDELQCLDFDPDEDDMDSDVIRHHLGSLSDLERTISLWISDLKQAMEDVKRCASDSKEQVRAVTAQMMSVIERREEELIEEIDEKSAAKIFPLDSQLSKLSQVIVSHCRVGRIRIFPQNASSSPSITPSDMFALQRLIICREAKREALDLLSDPLPHDGGMNVNNMPSKPQTLHDRATIRMKSSASTLSDQNARKVLQCTSFTTRRVYKYHISLIAIAQIGGACVCTL